MESKSILVTGSSGTIGTRLTEMLLQQGYKVIGADKVPNKWNKEINDLTIQVDLRNKEEVLSVLPKDVDFVIHLAANARVYDSVVDPTLAHDNFETLFNVLEFTRQSKIKKFLFSSSREVYGNSDRLVHTEEEAYVKNCESPYTATKIAGEALVHAYQQCYGIDMIVMRFSNVYGMYDDSNRLLPLFIRQCESGQDLTVFGKDKLLDFTYVDDTVAGILLCLEKFDIAKNEVYNIANGKGVTILEVAEFIKNLTGSVSKIRLGENRPGEVVKYIADISKAKKILGFNPKVSIDEGLRKSIEWYRTKPNA